jgi:glutathione synthase/RimK-type ligase-like ATP-grasp enzyme
MAETKKITAEQLETLVKTQRELNEILVNVGVLESQKHGLLHQLAEVNKTSEEFKSELQAQYGSININLEDGSYTASEEKVEDAEKPKAA